jgi:hypothetical protein
MRPARLFLLAALVLPAALTVAARTAAETTVGSSLGSRADFSTSCPASCTLLGDATVPKAGVVVRWRVRAATRGSVRLRILRPTAGALVGVASGPAQRLDRRHAPGRDVSYVFTVRLPVEAGDVLALDAGRGAAAVLHRRAGGPAVRVFTPAVPDGGAAGEERTVSGAELLLSADVEPDADGDGFGDETQDNCPSIANDQTSNPCPSTAATPTPTGNDDTDTKPPRTTGWRRHKHERHPFAP